MSPAVLAERLRAQLLDDRPAGDPVEVVQALLAVQGQDPRGARLAIRARSTGLAAGDVDRALSVDRSLLITWLNRGTLHLICSQDYGWLHALTAPRIVTANARRLAQEGVTEAAAERGLRRIERALSEEGSLTRAQLRDRLRSARVRTEGQALVHLLILATLRGLTVRGPMVGSEHAYVLVHDWLGETSPVQRERALAELARRYLAGHAPADARDLARWSGLALGDARAGLSAIAGELRQREDGLIELAKSPRARPSPRRRPGPRASVDARPDALPELPPPRLLGAFDPLLLGWCSREPIVGRNKTLVTDNGLFRPFALVGGRAVAIWKLAGGEVLLEPFGRLPAAARRALELEAQDVQRFLAG